MYIGSLFVSRSCAVKVAVFETVAAMSFILKVFRRCLHASAAVDAQRQEQDGVFCRNALFMGRDHDTGGCIRIGDTAFMGIRAVQAFHGYVAPTTSMIGADTPWWESQYGEQVDFDVKRGGMKMGHSYNKSMFVEGLKYIDVIDGRLLDNYK